MKVLIADDNVVLAEIVEVILGENGAHTVIKAHSTQNAVEVAKDNPDIALVILDKDCLGLGGITHALRGLFDGCKIVLYSGGVVGNEDPDEFGVDAVVPKDGYPTGLLQTMVWFLAA